MSSFFIFIYLIGYDLDSLVVPNCKEMTGKLLEFLLNSRTEVHGSAFLFYVVSEKRLLSSPLFTVTLTCTVIHHEFRFLFMFNLKSVSSCSNLFNAEYMNIFNFALSTTKV